MNPTTDLRRWNAGVGFVHLAQGLVILALANDFAIPVVAPVQTGPPGSPLTEMTTFFDLRFSFGIALFLFLAAADHLLMATPRVVDWYEANLARGINPARWIEYSLSASVMIVLIAMLPGITNFYALLALFGVNAAMILFGFVMEQVNTDRDRVNWSPFVFGCIAGAVPWIAIAWSMAVASSEGEGVPGFVYAIFVSLFLLFNCFALNQWLQYRGKGRFADYLYGERVYLVLSLVAKSALAWQVFAGTLAE
ncbi:MAG: heliorhodopsin HeR [Actinomycetota bacterium]|nr:heliorhodopsin HeR [Actinomycetota bacterium]